MGCYILPDAPQSYCEVLLFSIGAFYELQECSYYADNVGAEIRGLFDAGLTGGYMTWNGGGDWERYRACRSAFDIDP